ncbi:hypothetical protein [Natrinema caseinilyticum]|uniref:hypothetical protein n=1 Tax=Natrinema caseinilyticum TaxID=2961570 RepID=UPI0020C3E26F|nr:hypothetical protein [Natrinema caseinilyticum]
MIVAGTALTVPSPPAAPSSSLATVPGSVLTQAVTVAGAWMLVTLIVATGTVVVAPRSVRNRRDEVRSDPDVAFAVGFVAFFGLLLGSALPLFAGMALEHLLLILLGALVAIPGLFACAAMFVVGGCIGAIVVGDGLDSRLGSTSESLWRSLVLGTLVLGTSQLVPVFGAIVTIVAVCLGCGTIVGSGYEAVRGEALVTSSSSPSAGPGSGPRSRTRSVPVETALDASSGSHEHESNRRAHPTDFDASGTGRRDDRLDGATRDLESDNRLDETTTRPAGDGDAGRSDRARDDSR